MKRVASMYRTYYSLVFNTISSLTFLSLSARGFHYHASTCSFRFPAYEAPQGQHSLKSEAGHVAEMMVTFLQEKANVAGLQVMSFDMTDLSYAPEVAQGLLVRQQAEATLAARQIIARGGVLLATESLAAISAKGVEFSRDEKARLASNLLITICGESKSAHQATIPE